ncbi:HAMP domain-containing histidine kinase [bacterium]|nr:HAMP domain-containing histidine kinase [bacterium]
MLTKVKENTYKLNNLLETFLLLSRLENSLQCLNTQEIDFEEYIKKLVSNSGLLNEKKLKIDYNIFKKTKLKIENNTFNILFENILSNAIKFSKL